MSEPDKYDLEAAEMLPCGTEAHWHRPAVAARLRADAREIERLTKAKDDNYNIGMRAAADALVARDTEIERLKEENIRFERDAVFHRVKVEELKEQLAELQEKALRLDSLEGR